MQMNPGESLLEYYRRLAALRGGGVLGTQGMMDTPTAPVEAPVATAVPLGQLVQNVQDNGDGDGPAYTPGLTKQEILQRQIAKLGGEGVDYGQAAGGLMGPLGIMFGEAAQSYEKDAAALELGRQLGVTDIEEAKAKGYELLTEGNAANLINQAQAGDFGAVTDRGLLNQAALNTYSNPFQSQGNSFTSGIGGMFDGLVNLGKSVGGMFGIGDGVQEYGNNTFSRGMADNYTGPVLAATPGTDFDPTTFSSSYGDTSYENNNSSGATSGGNWSSANDSFSGGRDSDGWGE
jgi:hypothetical protein